MMKNKKKKDMKEFRGAEAVLSFQEDMVLKERNVKKYRNKTIDSKLRKERTRIEFKILEKLYKKGIPCPKPLKIDEARGLISMEWVKGKRLRDVLNRDNSERVANRVAEIVAGLHNQGIVHQDLTTSNFLIDQDDNIFIIDFGLSFFSQKKEDKAVDIHLLERAIESKHPEINQHFMKAFLKEYQRKCKDAKGVLKRLEKVEKRGRYKNKTKSYS